MTEKFMQAIKSALSLDPSSKTFWAIPLMAWMLLATASLIWNLNALRLNTLDAFRSEAKTLAEVTLATIRWTDHHERVFVPVTEWVPMEPFFTGRSEMEVVTTCGLSLTRLSPDRVVLQIAEQAHFHGWGRKSIRVLSLQSSAPATSPDNWELETLRRFENGQSERFALLGSGTRTMLRYMAPIRATATILTPDHGVMVGDLLGGVSITEAALSRLTTIWPQVVSMMGTHVGVFTIIAVALYLLLSRLRCQWLNLEQLNSEQGKMIVRLAESKTKLEEMAVTDELTGLVNRRGFLLFAERMLKAANRDLAKLWFIFIDVDGMKAINDDYGHSEGDNALRAVARLLKNTFRESDLVARIGGDEFVVVSSTANASSDCVVLSRLEKNIDLHNDGAQGFCRISLSAGIACCDPSERSCCNLEQLLKTADNLMYDCKRRKTNTAGARVGALAVIGNISSE